MGSEEDNLDKYGDEPEVRNGHKDSTKHTAEAELLHALILFLPSSFVRMWQVDIEKQS